MTESVVPPESLAFVVDLCSLDPRLTALMDREVVALGEVLPHVFMPEVVDWLVDALNGGEPADLALIDEVMAAVEVGFTSGIEPILNVLGLSFLDALPARGEHPVEIRERLGPECAAYVRTHGL